MKKLLSIALGILLVGGSVFATQQWVRDANPFHVFQAVKITSNGALSGDCFFQAQNGVVSDCQGNNFLTGGNLSGYITGYTESDPVWLATSGNYIPVSGYISSANVDVPYYFLGEGHNGVGDTPGTGEGYFFYDYSSPIIGISAHQVGVTLEYFDTLIKKSYVSIGSEIHMYNTYGKGIQFNNNGLVYYDDYSSGYVDRSMIDKGYADDTYLTGYTETDPVWSLASGNYLPTTLVGDITVTGNSNNLSFNDIGDFKIDADNFSIGDDINSPLNGVCIGDGCSIHASGATSIGRNSTATGKYAVALGYYSYAQGSDSLALGRGNYAIGGESISIGSNNHSNNSYGITIGKSNDAYSIGALAIGQNCTASGSYSNAIGNNSMTYEPYATVIGYGLSGNAMYGANLGKYNIGYTNSLLEIGGGGTATRLNALTIYNQASGFLAEFAGPIEINDGTNTPFKFAYSGGLMEGQYYTGGVWVSAVTYLLP